MATTKALKIQQEDASKWDALSLERSHHKEHKLKDTKYLKDNAQHNLKDLTLRYLTTLA
jgi:hypothetical protein